MNRAPVVRYRSSDEDSGRWLDFPFRSGDIVISTRSKSGTTWVQMIAAMLVIGSPELPVPLGELSPWLDWLVSSRGSVFGQLEAQSHRRVIKTHTPLDGLPLDERATYIVVARHPLDMAVSLYHQQANLDRVRLRELTGQAPPAGPELTPPPLRAWLLSWIDWSGPPAEALDSLPGVMWHLSDAWLLRDEANVVLVRYEDLWADLEGEMRRLASRLGAEPAAEAWPALVDAARFESMAAQAARVVPDGLGVLKDSARFFRRGSPGEGREVLSSGEVERYLERVATMAPTDLLAWLHRDPLAS